MTSARRVHRETGNRHQEGAPQMTKWNFVAMGQVGLTGQASRAAQPVARAVARWTGRPEAQILSLIGAGFLAISLIDFLRQVDAVIAAGRPHRQPATRPPPGRRASNPGDSSHSQDDDIAKTMTRSKP